MQEQPSDESSIIVGLDLHSGSPRSAKEAKYSVVVLKGRATVLKKRGIVLNDLVDLLKRFGKCTLATDNIFELAPDSSSLRALMLRLPESTKVVQVTRSPDGRPKSLSELVASAGLEVPQRADSLAEAEAIAQLGERGYGCEIVAFEPECRVLITKSSSVKHGGSRTNRWRRMIEASIHGEANKVISILEANGIQYDLYAQRGDGGLKRAELVVYAPCGLVRRLVKQENAGPVRISIARKMKKDIVFVRRPEKKMRVKPIIVSIDPGASLGLAVSDLFGKVLELKTLRRHSKSQVIEEIMKHGRPVLVTTDVGPVPGRVREVAQAFNARVDAVPSPLSVKEKEKLVRGFEENTGVRVSSSHERDSLAAILAVHKRLSVLFAKAKARAREMGLPMGTRVRESLIRGDSISEALRKAAGDVRTAKKKPRVRKVSSSKGAPVARLTKKIRDLQEKARLYEKLLEEREMSLHELRDELSSLRSRKNLELERDRRIAQRDRRIGELERELRKERWKNELLLTELRGLESKSREPPKGWVQVSVVRNLSKAAVEELLSSGRMRAGDVLLTIDANGAGKSLVEVLYEYGIAGVIWKKSGPPSEITEELEKRGIRVIDGRHAKIWSRGAVSYVPDKLIMNELLREKVGKRKVRLERLLKDYRSEVSESLQAEDNV